ncbi:hypothetical protein JRO89_XS08G0175300 [Xanthoceras sorbifolium]|uniref:Zinc-finger domain-containing protein n=1 Tax=Xanthoceras sorbifolium TaxID=99658 RepID=A0ABQ8HQ95_9ROSI|nr:hypothetical protein JRO89_XS08G0175300 [Xanthoceras sorbifolium]
MPIPKTLRETQQNPKAYNNHGQNTPTISLYEQSREDRIKENLERMQKLGIVDLSDKLKSRVRPKRTPKNSPSDSLGSTSLLPSEPLRRSSRLQNVTPISYSEGTRSNKENCVENEDVRLEPGSKPEVYTEEHEKLLGHTERSWTLFVDGCGQDGKRIYDPVKGKTCHQCRSEVEMMLGPWWLYVVKVASVFCRMLFLFYGCHRADNGARRIEQNLVVVEMLIHRQKTLGLRTQCSQCDKVQGQFCGDCLYMRYGEHVLEANENPNWICPPCRGICNCSLCRQAKGWCPTGALYKKISNLGFKSVAHYLIQTRRLQSNLEKNPDTINQASAKRSLSFKDSEALSKESLKVDTVDLGTSKLSEDRKDNNDLDTEKENKLQKYPDATTNHQTAAKRSLTFSYIEAEPENNSTDIDVKVLNQFGFSKPQLEDQRDSGFRDEQEKKLHYTDKDIALKGCPKPKKKRAAIIPSPDSIAGRLRQRRRKVNDLDDMELTAVNEKSLNVELPASNYLSEKKLEKEKEMQTCDDEHGNRNHTSDDKEELAGMTDKTSDVKEAVIDFVSEEEVDTNMKHVSAEEVGPDSIARRLRSRSQTT